MRCPGTTQAVEHSGTARSHHPKCFRRSQIHWCPGLDRAVPRALNGGIPDRAVLWTTAVFLSTKQGTASPAGPVHDCLQSPTPAVSLGANGQCCQGLCRETAFPVRRGRQKLQARTIDPRRPIRSPRRCLGLCKPSSLLWEASKAINMTEVGPPKNVTEDQRSRRGRGGSPGVVRG
ncbi:hypothetical protein ASPWEDRAFT_670176 [Aspergillus wentii DTO 134E9]|uniref:Uncharacterized protein n=1 Tax=Aspergillus wentii DTO 134E9 TaxID=1073089 RepID=A0A1L9RCH8_ASPWE|nr:uncharacterized protein ASPWEDRAFT_670176 [Aspergillus wentii DTO 134E9]OJJ32573.1 hypothetical protein ASPWEDRAFT_670176 [Aspergillus wentii DTO 134E9]